MFLYRPVGLEELALLFASGMTAFPERLPEQPIFYPVLNEGYATQIARDWNTKSNLLAGYVTRFAVRDAYVSSLPVQTVGAREHQELWVPAEALEEFNQEIEGQIAVVRAFFGQGFRGVPGTDSVLKGRFATEQLIALRGIHTEIRTDFQSEIAANREAVFVHFPFWKLRGLSDDGLMDPGCETLLNAIRTAWSVVSPDISLVDV